MIFQLFVLVEPRNFARQSKNIGDRGGFYLFSIILVQSNTVVEQPEKSKNRPNSDLLLIDTA